VNEFTRLGGLSPKGVDRVGDEHARQ